MLHIKYYKEQNIHIKVLWMSWIFFFYLITVEDQHLSPKQSPHGLHRLCLPSTCRTIRIPSQPHVHTCIKIFLLWKFYKNAIKTAKVIYVLLIGKGFLVREHYIQCPPNFNMHGYSFHYKYMYNRINQDILVSDLVWASGSTCLSVGCAPVLQHCPGTRKCTQTQHPPYLCYTGPFCSCRICNIPSNTLRPRHHS